MLLLFKSHLVFGHRTDNKRAHHPRQRTHAVGNAHQDAGVAWSDVQMIDIKAYRGEISTSLLGQRFKENSGLNKEARQSNRKDQIVDQSSIF